MLKINSQKKINKLLKNIEHKGFRYNVYGKILKVTFSNFLIFIDNFIPTFRALTFIALGLKKKNIDFEMFRIILHNKEN